MYPKLVHSKLGGAVACSAWFSEKSWLNNMPTPYDQRLLSLNELIIVALSGLVAAVTKKEG